MSKKVGIDYLNLRFKAGEWDKISAMLSEEGYSADAEGAIKCLLDLANDSSEDESEEDETKDDSALEKLFGYLKENPEALKLGKDFLINSFKKKMGL